MSHEVFISYSSKNSAAAQAICHRLEDSNIKCWMAPRDIPVGAKYASVITQAIKGCKVVVLVFSEYSAISQWVESEINIAFSNRKPIVPYKIDQAALENYDEFYLMLNNRHWIESYPDFKTRFADLIEVISNLVGVASPTLATVKTYKVGDYYNDGVREGVVFEVTEDGFHGKIVSMTQSDEEMPWSSSDDEQRRIIGANHESYGVYNTAEVKEILGWQDKYPAFAWCASLGDTWCLPAIDELKIFTLDATVRTIVNRTLSVKGGVKLKKEGEWISFWTSTESYKQNNITEQFSAWCVNMLSGKAFCSNKNSYHYVRAVAVF
ncbi:MAG: TIR domain-containing protein [Alistipes sp.]|nr:TIR domain-containing protein [Alistipes sp.]